MFVLLLLIILTSDYSKGEVELRSVRDRTVKCNERIVLQCNISSSVPLHIFKAYWKKQGENNFECDSTSSNNPPGFECNHTGEALTLTISNPTPANTGTYFCCIKTESGHGKANINLSIDECSGEFSSQMSGPNQIQCSFSGVYPEATINWFHYDKNLTSNSTTTSLSNSDGTFNITSVLNTQDKQKEFNCSLWSLRHGGYSAQEVNVAGQAHSSPVGRISTHSLSWTLILLSLMFALKACLS